jgi:hypothetical protein
MDFITDLPSSNSKDSILVVVDLFTKMAHFFSYNETIIVEEIVKIFFDNIYYLQGLPKELVFNSKLQFISNF